MVLTILELGLELFLVRIELILAVEFNALTL